MPGKTDRQTDKAMWWSVTAFGDEIILLEDKSNYPDFVKEIFGGREICPDTDREHFQGAINCNRQVRMSALKKWLPTSHLEPARNVQALKQYAMKLDTAVDNKHVRVNEIKYQRMSDTCMILARIAIEQRPDTLESYSSEFCKDLSSKEAIKYWVYYLINLAVERDINFINYVNTQVINNFIMCYNTLVDKAMLELGKKECDSITHSGLGGFVEDDEGQLIPQCNLFM